MAQAIAMERLAKIEGVIEGSYKHLATREDVQTVRTDLVGVKAELQEEGAGVKTDVQAVRTELASIKAELHAVKTELAGVKTELHAVKTELAGVKTDV